MGWCFNWVLDDLFFLFSKLKSVIRCKIKSPSCQSNLTSSLIGKRPWKYHLSSDVILVVSFFLQHITVTTEIIIYRCRNIQFIVVLFQSFILLDAVKLCYSVTYLLRWSECWKNRGTSDAFYLHSASTILLVNPDSTVAYKLVMSALYWSGWWTTIYLICAKLLLFYKWFKSQSLFSQHIINPEMYYFVRYQVTIINSLWRFFFFK